MVFAYQVLFMSDSPKLMFDKNLKTILLLKIQTKNGKKVFVGNNILNLIRDY